MKKPVIGERAVIECSAEALYEFLTDFNHFSKLLPDQVSDWKVENDTCSFHVKGITTITAEYTEKIPYSNIKLAGHGKMGVHVNLYVEVKIEQIALQQAAVQFIVTSDINEFMAMMAYKPLETFTNRLTEELKKYVEQGHLCPQ